MESPEPTDDDAVMITKTNNENAENTQSAVSEDRRPSLFDAIWPWATRGEDQFTAQIKSRAVEALEAERKAEEEAEQEKREAERKAAEETENAKRAAEVVEAQRKTEELGKAEEDTSVANKMHEEKNIFVKEIER